MLFNECVSKGNEFHFPELFSFLESVFLLVFGRGPNF